MWNEGIEMAQTAYALDEAVRPRPPGRPQTRLRTL